MIAKLDLVANGRKLINYVFEKEKQAELIASNMIGSDNSSEIHLAFSAIADRNKRCKLKYMSLKIGVAPNDEARFRKNPYELEAICNEFSKELGFDNHQWFACTHNDTDNLHIHMIINRIPVDSAKACNVDFISNRAFRVAEGISRRRGLTIASERRKNGNNRYLDTDERHTARVKIEYIVAQALANKPKSLEQFIKHMNKQGVKVIAREHKNKGSVYGLRFSLDDENFKASEIGKQYGYNQLIKNIQENVSNAQSKTLTFEPKQDYSSTSRQGQNIFEEFSSIIGSPDEQDTKRKKKRKFKR